MGEGRAKGEDGWGGERVGGGRKEWGGKWGICVIGFRGDGHHCQNG